MLQKLKNFIKKDPVLFVIIVVIAFAGFIFSQVEVLHITSESKFCGKCHPEQKNGPLGEYHTWSKNIHSAAKVECIDCHGEPGLVGYMKAKVGGLRDLYGEFFKSHEHKIDILTKGASDTAYAEKLVPKETCMHCHTDSVNAQNRKSKVMSVGVDFRLIDNVVNPKFRESFGRADIMKGVSVGVDPNHKAHIEKAGLSCVSCHKGVAHGGSYHNLPKMENCFACHDAVKGKVNNPSIPKNDDCQACHKMQKQIQEGKFVKGVDETRWYMADLNCSDCHKDAFSKPNTDTCVTCHNNPSYAQTMHDTQKEFTEKLINIQKIRDSYLTQRESMPEGKLKLFNELHYMVRVLEKDGSKGIHNPEYFNSIFDAAAALNDKIKNYKEEPATLKTNKKADKEKAEKPQEQVKKVLKANNPKELTDIAPASINLAEKNGIKGTKPAVNFDHKKHFEMFECKVCHEKPEEGTLKVQITKKDGTDNSYHKELCFPCHKENKVKNGTSCNTCHK